MERIAGQVQRPPHPHGVHPSHPIHHVGTEGRHQTSHDADPVRRHVITTGTASPLAGRRQSLAQRLDLIARTDRERGHGGIEGVPLGIGHAGIGVPTKAEDVSEGSVQIDVLRLLPLQHVGHLDDGGLEAVGVGHPGIVIVVSCGLVFGDIVVATGT